MKTLYCNKRGDQRFWDEKAQVEVFGVCDTIANHFRNATKTNALVINGCEYDKKYTRHFYNLMWVKYLNKNSLLVQVASQYKRYSGNPADVIYAYIHESKSVIMENEEMKEFIKEMNKNK